MPDAIVLEHLDPGHYVVRYRSARMQTSRARDCRVIGTLQKIPPASGWGVSSWTYTRMGSTAHWTEVGLKAAKARILREELGERAA